jgi:hypothetical protein
MSRLAESVVKGKGFLNPETALPFRYIERQSLSRIICLLPVAEERTRFHAVVLRRGFNHPETAHPKGLNRSDL